MKRYIINGNVCLQSKVKKVDIEINNNVISNIGVNIEKVEGAEIIDAKGLTVIPGIIDFHTHLEEKGQLFNQIDTYSSGSKLAILNGITTINAFIVQNFNQSLAQAITSVAAQAENNTYCDYRWHLTPTRFSDINFSDISRWIDKGIKTFKFYTTYKTANLYLSYDRINEIIRRLKKYEPQIIIHCEDETIMNQMYIKHDFHDLSNYTKIHSEEAELTAIEKIIQLCKSIQTPIHIDMSSSDAIDRLTARDCLCETTPHYIFHNENRLQR